MIEARGVTVVELDRRASEPFQPFGIITADCTGAHEFDDGIAVTPLPSAQETYLVHVFASDTSQLYRSDEVIKRVLKQPESLYGGTAGSNEYRPMLEQHDIDRLSFRQGETRKAVVVSFMIGAFQPPTDVSIGFGKVEVAKNWRYDKFGQKCRYSDDYKAFGRVAALIAKHLQAPIAPGDTPYEDVYHNLIHVPPAENFKRGNNINQAFMIAANYLTIRAMHEEGRLSLYRIHDPADFTFAEFLSPRVARFSTSPGPHVSLGLPYYTRVTSGLRRGEDLVMHGLLRARHDDRELTPRDERIARAMVQCLNQRIAALSRDGRFRITDEDVWYKPDVSAEDTEDSIDSGNTDLYAAS